MSLGSFYRGTTIEQDGRFRNKEKKLMGNINFPKELGTLIEPSKIQMKVIKEWIENKMKTILGFEDEFCVNYTISLLEEKVDPKKIHLQLIGFLNNETFNFMSELWKLLMSAQNSPNGIPPELVEERKKETKKNKSDEKMENIKCLEKIIAKEDEKLREKNNNISKKKYRDDDSDSVDKRRKKKNYSRSRSRSRDSYDDKYRRRHSREKKSKHKRNKRSRSNSRCYSIDRKNNKDNKKHKKSDRHKEDNDKSEKYKPEEIKFANSKDAEDTSNRKETKPLHISAEDLEKSKREILNMHIEKK